MSPHPIRLLLVGYGLALLGATAFIAAGGAFWLAAVGAWVGGAILTLCIAATPALRGRFRASETDRSEDADATLARALAQWEADRAADLGQTGPGRENSAG